jgi:hypothetical protein
MRLATGFAGTDTPPARLAFSFARTTKSTRSTGHSWCLSQLATGCGGQGLCERTQCGPCGSSVIDKTFAPIWQEMYDHQLELRSDAEDLGPGAVQRVERDLARARSVLSDLGATLAEHVSSSDPPSPTLMFPALAVGTRPELRLKRRLSASRQAARSSASPLSRTPSASQVH